jgi:hypothetical protein
MKLTTHLYLAPRLRMSGFVPPLSYAFNYATGSSSSPFSAIQTIPGAQNDRIIIDTLEMI